jgi:hypothetical protein
MYLYCIIAAIFKKIVTLNGELQIVTKNDNQKVIVTKNKNVYLH